MSIWSTLPGLDSDSPGGAPYQYYGSTAWPALCGQQRGAIQLATIPSHITPDGHDDAPEDGRPWPWLRLALDWIGPDPVAVLTVDQVRNLVGQLAGWLDQVSPEPAHEDGHTGATGATEPTGDPSPAETANGPQTGAQGREADDDWGRTLRAKLRGAQAETRDLRDEKRKLVREADALTESNTRLRSELREARATVQRVRALHRPLDGPGTPCDHCGYAAPCPTAAAIDQPDTRP